MINLKNALLYSVLGLLITMPSHAQIAFDDPLSGGGSSSGTLVAVEPTVDTGEVNLGSSVQAVVRFRNDAVQPVTFSDINIYPSSNVSVSTVLNQCAETPLQYGGECAIVLSVKALKAGAFNSQILVQHSGRSKLITNNITGNVLAGDDVSGQDSSEIAALPSILDFETVETSRPVLKTIELRNITSDAINIVDVEFDSPQKSGFGIRNDCSTLNPGQNCLISVIWSPAAQGPSSGFIVIKHDGTSQVTNIPVKGMYQPTAVSDVATYPDPISGEGLLISSAQSIDFGDAVDSESAITVTAVNAGDADLTIKNIKMSVITPGLSVDPTGCKNGVVLKPNAACPLTVRWAPQKVGKLKTDISILHDGTRGVFVMPITGVATEVVQGGGFVPSQQGFSSGGVNTSLPGSAGLSLDEIAELNGTLDNDIAGVVSRITNPSSRVQGIGLLSNDDIQINNSATTIAGYVITTHSINKAVIMGPDGGRVVSHNKPLTIAGARWTPTIIPEGVEFKSADKVVTLYFDDALIANRSLLTDNSTTNDGGLATFESNVQATATQDAVITNTPPQEQTDGAAQTGSLLGASILSDN